MILDAWGWYTETTQRDGMGKEEGGRFKSGDAGIHTLFTLYSRTNTTTSLAAQMVKELPYTQGHAVH